MAKQTFTTGQVLTAAQMTSLQQTAMGGGDTTAKTASYTLVAADAGTVVAMNSASATTITVNTALFAAGDTVTIQNRGAGVCTVTAGTATVVTAGSLALSQNEGGILYFTATGSAVFYDYVQSGTPSPTWTTYTPTNSGITVGNGTQTARFSETGNIVCVSYKFVLGSTSSVTGGVSVGLPSTNNSVATCAVTIADAGTNNYTGIGTADPSAGNVLIRPIKTDGTYGTWSDNLGAMFTWAVNDILQFSITYEKA